MALAEKDVAWEQFEKYVSTRCSPEVKWVSFLRHGTLKHKLKEVTFKDGAIVDKTVEAVFTLSTPVDILADINDNDKRRLQKQIQSENPDLVPRSKQVKALAEANPGTPYRYHTENGYFSSVILKLVNWKLSLAAPSQPEPEPEPVRPSSPSAQYTILDTIDEEMVSPPLRRPKSKPKPATNKCISTAPFPNPMQQILRTCGNATPLIRYLKRKNKFQFVGEAQWRAIREWTKTEEGTEYIKMAGLDPSGFHIDHIVPKAGMGAGLYSVYNAYLMPASINSSFGDELTKEKKDYIGEGAVKIALEFQRWVRATMLVGLDQSKFSGVCLS